MGARIWLRGGPEAGNPIVKNKTTSTDYFGFMAYTLPWSVIESYVTFR